MSEHTKKNNKVVNFIEIWNQLSQSQKTILFKLGQVGWKLDYLSHSNIESAKIVHINGDKGHVTIYGEVEFFENNKVLTA